MKIKDLIKKQISKMNIKTKETVLILLSMTVPLIFFVVVLNVVLQSYSRDVAFHNVSGSVNLLTNSIEEQTNVIYQNSVLMLRDPNIRYLAQEPSSAGLNVPYIDEKSAAVMLVDNLSEAEFIDSINFYVTDLRNYLIDNNYFFMLTSIEDQEWFNKVTQAHQKGIWVDTSTPFKTSLSYVTKIVFLSNYKKYNSILKVDYDIHYLQTMLDNSMVSPASFCGILDNTNRILMTANGSDIVNFEGSLDFTRYTLKNFSKETIDGIDYWVYVTNVPKADWNIVTLVPTNSFNFWGSIKSFVPIVLAVVLCWAVIIVISVLNISSMTARIQTISTHVKFMREGNISALIPSFRQQDEITELADNVNHLQMELKENLDRNYVLGLAKKSSDLRALQAQINPHFLYNTLEMIDYYAFEGQPEVVEEIVSKLSRFYKLSLNNGKELYSLREELKLVESYFDIQSLRFQNKIKLDMNIPDHLMSVVIPPITLQPLVENSIIHGIREKEDKRGIITISAKSDDERVIISVADDGIGIPEETLQKINTETLQLTGSSISSGHYGIRNINQRLKIMFGEEYGLTVQNGSVGVVVEIILPL